MDDIYDNAITVSIRIISCIVEHRTAIACARMEFIAKLVIALVHADYVKHTQPKLCQINIDNI